MVKVSLIRGKSSFLGTLEALNLITDDIFLKVKGRSKFFIKPNFVSVWRRLSATPVESVDALLSYLSDMFSPSELLIAESPANGSLIEGLKNYGYLELKKKYKVDFLYLDEDDFEPFEVYNSSGEIFHVNIAKTVLKEDFFKISICRPKTHNTVVVTLTVKNMAMGVLPRSDKPKMHQGYYYINLNIAKVAGKVLPDLGVIDGLVGMEGNGPVSGEPKKWGVFAASTNPVELDAIIAYAMGFNPKDIGYLYFLNRWGYGEIDPEKIRVVGVSIDEVKTCFKPHRTIDQQYSWKRHVKL